MPQSDNPNRQPRPTSSFASLVEGFSREFQESMHRQVISNMYADSFAQMLRTGRYSTGASNRTTPIFSAEHAPDVASFASIPSTSVTMNEAYGSSATLLDSLAGVGRSTLVQDHRKEMLKGCYKSVKHIGLQENVFDISTEEILNSPGVASRLRMFASLLFTTANYYVTRADQGRLFSIGVIGLYAAVKGTYPSEMTAFTVTFPEGSAKAKSIVNAGIRASAAAHLQGVTLARQDGELIFTW